MIVSMPQTSRRTPTGPPIGVHLSIAGGHHNALEQGRRLGCDVVQIFTKSSNQWRATALSAEDAARFRDTRDRLGIRFVLGHASYLINLASPDAVVRERSVASLTLELRRAGQLGLDCLIVHPGSHRGAGPDKGLARVVRAVDRVCARTGRASPVLALETMSGQGRVLGHRFEQLAWVLDRAAMPERLGVCLDTCHVFAAGYDLRTPRCFRRVFDEFDQTVGLGRLVAVHLNDAKHELGSRMDRHAHIGQGKMGLGAFRNVLRSKPLQSTPMCLETPKGKGMGNKCDIKNLRILRSLMRHGNRC